MLKRPQYLALGVVLLCTFALLRLPSRASANLKLAISGLFLPLFGMSGSLAQVTENTSYLLLSRRELIRQLQWQHKTNQIAELHLRQAGEWKRENDRLRDYFNIQRQHAWKPALARVVARDPVNWWKTITIDRGARDGVVTNAPVVTAEGLVGRVSTVTFAQSQVVLVGDPDCRVSVLVGDDKSREQGVIAPASSTPLDHALVDLSYLSRNSKLAPGQYVVTSGMGGIFPKGIVVGQIADFRNIGYGLYKEAQVRLAVNMNRLEEVFILTP
jgi:rod shape-determining protein MreC